VAVQIQSAKKAKFASDLHSHKILKYHFFPKGISYIRGGRMNFGGAHSAGNPIVNPMVNTSTSNNFFLIYSAIRGGILADFGYVVQQFFPNILA
jgi:hypothetical protein